MVEAGFRFNITLLITTTTMFATGTSVNCLDDATNTTLHLTLANLPSVSDDRGLNASEKKAMQAWTTGVNKLVTGFSLSKPSDFERVVDALKEAGFLTRVLPKKPTVTNHFP